jgi:hypothetical protein
LYASHISPCVLQVLSSHHNSFRIITVTLTGLEGKPIPVAGRGNP